MRSTLIIQGSDLDRAMQFAEKFELIANVHITGFSHITTPLNGVNVVEIHFEENEDTPSMEQSSELEYTAIEDQDYEYPEYSDYPDWDEDE